jgi:hypothetical protein
MRWSARGGKILDFLKAGEPAADRLRSAAIQFCSISFGRFWTWSAAHFTRCWRTTGACARKMVTPFIVGDELKGVLSVHELRAVRA